MSIMPKRGRHIWEIGEYALVPGHVFKLSWTDALPTKVGSKGQRHLLLTSSKQLYLAIYGEGNGRGKRYSPLRLQRAFDELKALIRWMAMRSIWRYSDLQFLDVVDFIKDRPARTRGNLLTEATFRKWKRWFGWMWEFRGKYVNPIGFDIASIETELSAQIRTRPNRVWAAIDDDVTYSLIKDGLALIDEFGPFMVDVVNSSWRESELDIGRKRDVRIRRSTDFYHNLAEKYEYKQLAKRLSYVGSVHKTLSIALSVMEGACAFLLLILVGLRASELLALDIDCIVEQESSDGSKLTYIKGVAAKRNGYPRLWVAADPVVKVVKFVLELTQIMRRGNEFSRALFVSRPPGSPFFRIGCRQNRWKSNALHKRIRMFAQDGIRKESVQASRIHPHMARKSFAQLAVRRDRSRLEPVAAQLGHVYRSFTDRNYVGFDHELASLLVEADRRELARGLEHLLTCDGIAGGSAPALMQIREQVGKFRGRKSLQAVVDGLISKGVLLAPCDWGFCVYSRVYSACGGDDRGPNEANRAPDVCAGCQNFSVTPLHRPWWEERARREESFLKQQELPEQTRAVVGARLESTRMVLAKVIWAGKQGDLDEEQTATFHKK